MPSGVRNAIAPISDGGPQDSRNQGAYFSQCSDAPVHKYRRCILRRETCRILMRKRDRHRITRHRTILYQEMGVQCLLCCAAILEMFMSSCFGRAIRWWVAACDEEGSADRKGEPRDKADWKRPCGRTE